MKSRCFPPEKIPGAWKLGDTYARESSGGLLLVEDASERLALSSPVEVESRRELGSKEISARRRAPALGWSVEKGKMFSSNTTSRDI
jgi:hypothetical protein